jgi:Transposase DDE domain
VQTIVHRMKPSEGQKLYALRKQIPEPAFSIIKAVMGFPQFLLRGIDNVRSKWNLVTMAWNMKRMFVLEGAS